MTDAKKTDERLAATFLHSIGLGRGVERGEDSGKVRATVALIQAVRAERDAELALDRAIVEAAERCCAAYRNDAVFSIDDFNEAARELLRAVEAKRSATSSPQAAHSERPPKP